METAVGVMVDEDVVIMMMKKLAIAAEAVMVKKVTVIKTVLNRVTVVIIAEVDIRKNCSAKLPTDDYGDSKGIDSGHSNGGSSFSSDHYVDKGCCCTHSCECNDIGYDGRS